MSIRRAAVVAVVLVPSLLVGLVFAGCEDSSGPSATGNAFDSGGGFTSDSSVAPEPDATSPPDAAIDAPDTDAGPGYDEAGCPLPSGVVGNLADAGFTTTGLSLWLRADLGLAATDAGVVCRWDDVSGHDRAFLPATATPPLVDSAGLNGKPSVSFPSDGHHLIRGDVLGIAATSGRTAAVFASSSDTATRHQLFYQGKLGTPGTYFGIDANSFNTVGGREGVYVTNNSFDSDLATSTTPHTYILSISSFAPGGLLPGVLVYEVDGVVRTLTRNAGGLGDGTVEDFSAPDMTYFGSASPGYLGGKVGEMLVWDHALTEAERLAVEQYFQRRY